MLNCLALSTYNILSGAGRGFTFANILGVTPGSVLRLADDCHGRFMLAGLQLAAGPNPTDHNLYQMHVITIEERLGLYCLYTGMTINVIPSYAINPNPPVYHHGGVISGGKITGAGAAPVAAQQDPPKSVSQLMGEGIKRMADLFVGENVKTFRPEGVVIPKTRIALYSKQHADMVPGSVRMVRIAGEGEKLATMICLPGERYDYQAGWSDCITVGLVVEGGTQ